MNRIISWLSKCHHKHRTGCFDLQYPSSGDKQSPTDPTRHTALCRALALVDCKAGTVFDALAPLELLGNNLESG